MNIMSNLMKQWITEDGEFDVDFIKEIRLQNINVDDLKNLYGGTIQKSFWSLTGWFHIALIFSLLLLLWHLMYYNRDVCNQNVLAPDLQLINKGH